MLKKVIKFSIAILIYGLQSNVSGQSLDVMHTLDSCNINRKVSSIPRGVKQAIKHTYNTRVALANPSQKFQKSDIVYGRILRERRLVFWACCSDIYILAYEHGGLGYHNHIIILNSDGDSFHVVKNLFYTGGKPKSLEDVKYFLMKDKIVSLDHF